MGDAKTPFLSDVKTLRDRARQHLGRGAVTCNRCRWSSVAGFSVVRTRSALIRAGDAR